MLAYLRHRAADAGGAPVLPLLSCTLSSHVSIPVSMLRYLICVSCRSNLSGERSHIFIFNFSGTSSPLSSHLLHSAILSPRIIVTMRRLRVILWESSTRRKYVVLPLFRDHWKPAIRRLKALLD